jgi:DNA-directed RNA polymerase specialized sigma24 family protein
MWMSSPNHQIPPVKMARLRSCGAYQLADSLAHLSWDKRQTVLLYCRGRFNLAEIAELRGEGLSATKSRLSRARRDLRRTMLEGHPDLSANRRQREMDPEHGQE